MKSDRFQICVIIALCCLLAYHAIPLVEANPTIGPILKEILEPIVKIVKSGEIDAAHKSVEKAIQKIKDNPATYGFAADIYITANDTLKYIETVNSTDYNIESKFNDYNQWYEVYVNGEKTIYIAYKVFANLSEDEVTTKLTHDHKMAIPIYKMKQRIKKSYYDITIPKINLFVLTAGGKIHDPSRASLSAC